MARRREPLRHADGSGGRRGAHWFHPITGARAHEEVIQQLVFAIRAGLFRPGDQLPHIEELSQAMRVSKPTVGEAVKRLSADGIVRARRGSFGGVSVVSDDIPLQLLRSTLGGATVSVPALLEARRPIEMTLARLVGERATSDDLNLLRQAVEELERIDREADRARWIHYDHLFHYAMGRAARSEVLARYQHEILQHLFVALHEYFVGEEDPDTVRRVHRETLEAFEARDRARTEAVMDHHLALLEEALARGQVRISDAPLLDSVSRLAVRSQK